MTPKTEKACKTPTLPGIINDTEFQQLASSKHAFRRRRSSNHFMNDAHIFGMPEGLKANVNEDLVRTFENVAQLGDSMEKTWNLMRKDQLIISLNNTYVSSQDAIDSEGTSDKTTSKADVILIPFILILYRLRLSAILERDLNYRNINYKQS